MTVVIKTVETKKELAAFAKFGNRFYKGHKCYVPSMPSDDMVTFDRNKNAAFEFCEAEYFLAYKNNEVVGRVAAIVNHKANKAWNVEQVRFGWFDFIDDLEVSKVLLDAVISFGKSKGMKQIAGPLGFTDFDPEGMLVDGFDRMCTMALFYNHPYYPEHMKKHGYIKETGWLEYRITIPTVVPERLKKLSELVLERFNLRLIKKTKSEVMREKYGQKIFQLINETYCNLYGFSLLSPKQIDQFVDTYLGVVNMKMLTFVENEQGELVGAALTMPSIASALQKCNGEIFPIGWWHILKSMYWKPTDTLELLLIGVRPDYQNRGVNSVLCVDILENCHRMGFKYAETNANLEDNVKIQAMWAPFEKEQHKKRWIFAKDI